MRQTDNTAPEFKFNNREIFEKVLNDFGIKRGEICIIGSVILDYFDIRENRDVDFLCTYDARERIYDQIRNENMSYQIESQGGVKFGENKVGLTRKDRFDMFGLSDDEVVYNSRYHFVEDGFKLLRPELELSSKSYRGNDKDKQDIELIEEHLIGREKWDWDLVYVVPPWYGEQRDLVSEAWDILQYEGPMRLLKGGVNHLWTQVVQDRVPRKEWFLQLAPFYEVHPYSKTTENVDLTELLDHQYNEDGQFVREDIVPAILTLEGQLQFNDCHTGDVNKDEIVISRDGRICDEIWKLASIIKEATNGGTYPRPEDISTTVSVGSKEELPERTWEWVKSRFNAEEREKIKQRRRKLFQSMGLVFYSFLWPAAREHFDELEDQLAQIGQNIEIVEYENITGFDEMVMDIYTSDKRTDDWRIQKKIHELNKYDQVFRVVSFELPNPEFRPNETPKISSKTHELKYSCRRDLQSEIDNYVFDIILHVTDNYRQNVHVTKVLDSIENGEYTGHDDYST